MADKVNLYTAGLLASHIDVNGQGDKFLSNNGEYKTADIEDALKTITSPKIVNIKIISKNFLSNLLYNFFIYHLL